MNGRAAFAWILAFPAAVAGAAGFLWLFGIELKPAAEWSTFPDGWTLMVFLQHAFALALLAGLTRAFRKIIGELWLEKDARARPLPGDYVDD